MLFSVMFLIKHLLYVSKILPMKNPLRNLFYMKADEKTFNMDKNFG